MESKLSCAINKAFLNMVEKTANFIKTPETGYVWRAKYDDDKILLTYTNGEISNSVYLDIVNNKCINHEENHNINLCIISQSVLNALMNNIM